MKCRNIFFVNCYCSNNTFARLFEQLKQKPEVSIQNYMELLYEGFYSCGLRITTLSERQIERDDRIFWPFYSDQDKNGFDIFYTHIINLTIIIKLCMLIFNFMYVVYRYLFKCRPDITICDAMRFYTSFPALLVSKIFRVKCIGYVADIPQMYKHQKTGELGKLKTFLKKVYSRMIVHYDGYILLSPYMNEFVNPHKKPYVVIEGLVRTNEQVPVPSSSRIESPISIMYSGGLYEKYGVKLLIDAFHRLKEPNIRLWLFGHGDLDEYIHELKDERIDFYGYVTHDIILSKQQEAHFLINPRPTTEEYTKYSFPSKMMEYMSSGNPVISTRLLSMPYEYLQYIIPIEDESVEGIMCTLENAIKMSDKDRITLGTASADFVTKNKNSFTQAKRIISFIEFIFNRENNGNTQ